MSPLNPYYFKLQVFPKYGARVSVPKTSSSPPIAVVSRDSRERGEAERRRRTKNNGNYLPTLGLLFRSQLGHLHSMSSILQIEQNGPLTLHFLDPYARNGNPEAL